MRDEVRKSWFGSQSKGQTWNESWGQTGYGSYGYKRNSMVSRDWVRFGWAVVVDNGVEVFGPLSSVEAVVYRIGTEY